MDELDLEGRIGNGGEDGTKSARQYKKVRHGCVLRPRIAPLPPKKGALPPEILEAEEGMDAWKLAF